MNVAQITPLADTWGMHGDVGWGWMVLMMSLMVIFWAAVVVGIVWLIRSATRGGPTPGETPASKETALEILERRFAEGALTLEDYRARREVLMNGAAEPNGASEDTPRAASRAEEARQ
jgi:putative membrane protein